MKEFIKKTIRPIFFFGKTGVLILNYFSLIFNRILDDQKLLLKSWFPAICSEKDLDKHAQSFYIQKFSFDSKIQFRRRVANAIKWFEGMGTKSQFDFVVSGLFGGVENYTYRTYGKVAFFELRINQKYYSKDRQKEMWAYFDQALAPYVEFYVYRWWFTEFSSRLNYDNLVLEGGSKFLLEKVDGATDIYLGYDDALVVGEWIMGDEKRAMFEYGVKQLIVFFEEGKRLEAFEQISELVDGDEIKIDYFQEAV